MSVPKHTIRKKTLEVAFEGAKDAFELKEQLSGFCTLKLFPAIEKVFDEKSIKGKVLRADKLIIDVGELPEENWQDILCEKIVKQLLRLLSSSSSAPGLFTYSEFSASSSVNETELIAQGFTQDLPGIEELSESENAVQLIFYFLETGLLPWHTPAKNKGDLQNLMEVALDQDRFLLQLARKCKAEPKVLERLVQQFYEPVLDRIITAFGVDKKMMARVKAFVLPLFNKIHITAVRQKLLLYRPLLAIVFARSNQRESVLSLDEFGKALCYEILKSLTSDQLSQAAEALRPGNSTLEKQAREIVEKLSTGSHKGFEKRRKPDSENRPVPDSSKEQEYFISNAGLVLLHPFLSALFENAGYTEKNKWLSEEVQQRALVLSQYLITGKEEYPEFDLLLNKILLGYPEELTLPGEIVLSNFEKNEAQDLLHSVIRHWAALKNTSIEGLQTTFLQRDGKVWFGDAKYYLKAEQKTVDILMNKLPWSISIIRTPWMDHMMHVEWN